MCARVELSPLRHRRRVGLPAERAVLVDVVVVEVKALLLLKVALVSLVLLERTLNRSQVGVELVELLLCWFEVAVNFGGGDVGLVDLLGGVVNSGLDLVKLGSLAKNKNEGQQCWD